jgi:hypothetical protein
MIDQYIVDQLDEIRLDLPKFKDKFEGFKPDAIYTEDLDALDVAN